MAYFKFLVKILILTKKQLKRKASFGIRIVRRNLMTARELMELVAIVMKKSDERDRTDIIKLKTGVEYLPAEKEIPYNGSGLKDVN